VQILDIVQGATRCWAWLDLACSVLRSHIPIWFIRHTHTHIAPDLIPATMCGDLKRRNIIGDHGHGSGKCSSLSLDEQTLISFRCTRQQAMCRSAGALGRHLSAIRCCKPLQVFLIPNVWRSPLSDHHWPMMQSFSHSVIQFKTASFQNVRYTRVWKGCHLTLFDNVYTSLGFWDYCKIWIVLHITKELLFLNRNNAAAVHWNQHHSPGPFMRDSFLHLLEASIT